MKNTIKISESRLRGLIKESIYRIINENVNELNAYHGSYANFDKFKLNNDIRSSGEGSTSTPWGVYVTTKKDVANYYASAVSRKRNFDKELGMVKDKGWVYTVEIPDEKNYNYLVFSKNAETWAGQERAILYVLNKLVNSGAINRYEFGYLYKHIAPYKIDKNDKFIGNFNQNLSLVGNIKNNGVLNGVSNYWNTKRGMNRAWEGNIKSIARLYDLLAYFFADEHQCSTTEGRKLASEALYKSGFVGIKIPTGYYGHSSFFNEYNYVIFNPNDIKIISKEPTKEEISNKR